MASYQDRQGVGGLLVILRLCSCAPPPPPLSLGNYLFHWSSHNRGGGVEAAFGESPVEKSGKCPWE